jgi:DJ-1/PfpI family
MIRGSLVMPRHHHSSSATTRTTTAIILLLASSLALLRAPRVAQSFVFNNVVKPTTFVARSTFTSSSSLAMSSSSPSASSPKKKRVLVPIANGSEEIETTCITDTLVRFGADVTVATVHDSADLICKMSRGIKVVADTTMAKAALEDDWDLIVLPGGMPGSLSCVDV